LTENQNYLKTNSTAKQTNKISIFPEQIDQESKQRLPNINSIFFWNKSMENQNHFNTKSTAKQTNKISIFS
jgi:hypothetical protein